MDKELKPLFECECIVRFFVCNELLPINNYVAKLKKVCLISKYNFMDNLIHKAIPNKKTTIPNDTVVFFLSDILLSLFYLLR